MEDSSCPKLSSFGQLAKSQNFKGRSNQFCFPLDKKYKKKFARPIFEDYNSPNRTSNCNLDFQFTPLENGSTVKRAKQQRKISTPLPLLNPIQIFNNQDFKQISSSAKLPRNFTEFLNENDQCPLHDEKILYHQYRFKKLNFNLRKSS